MHGHVCYVKYLELQGNFYETIANFSHLMSLGPSEVN